MAILPKAIYRFYAITIKLPMTFFKELEQTIQTFHMEPQKTQNHQGKPEKQKPSRKHNSHRIQAILQSTVIKIACYWYQNRQTDKWNRIENLEINPDNYGQFILDKGGKNIKWEKDSLFSESCWETWTVA